jgi:hypothetical protein
MFRIALAVLVSFTALSVSASPGTDHHKHPTPKTSKGFETMKSWVGQWEGTTGTGDKMQTATVTYELTSGGTAIMERLFQGTPHEMVTIYYTEGDGVGLTHYCSLGNQPKMKMKSATDTAMTFEMGDMSGLKIKTEPHMHKLNVAMVSPDQMKHEWTMYEGGKKKDTTVINMTRKK